MRQSGDSQTAGHLYFLLFVLLIWALGGVIPALGVPRTPQFTGSSGQDMVVEVRGFIPSEGLYFLPAGFTSADLLRATLVTWPGQSRHPDLAQLQHLSSYFYDGRSLIKRGAIANQTKLALGYRIDLNQAVLSDLELIPQISTRTAERILDFRNQRGKIRNLEELGAIKGIKDKKIDALKKYLYVEHYE